jgi:hypothetical protein
VAKGNLLLFPAPSSPLLPLPMPATLIYSIFAPMQSILGNSIGIGGVAAIAEALKYNKTPTSLS